MADKTLPKIRKPTATKYIAHLPRCRRYMVSKVCKILYMLIFVIFRFSTDLKKYTL